MKSLRIKLVAEGIDRRVVELIKIVPVVPALCRDLCRRLGREWIPEALAARVAPLGGQVNHCAMPLKPSECTSERVRTPVRGLVRLAAPLMRPAIEDKHVVL